MKTTSKYFLIFALILFQSCTTWKIIKYNFAGIDDYKIFPSRPLAKSTQSYIYRCDVDNNRVPKTFLYKQKSHDLDCLMEDNNTVAFIVIKNDTIVYEEYFGNHQSSSISTIFSISKSFTSALIGCAIEDGYITSVNDPVSKYIPELKKNGFDKVKISNLLQMTSGINYSRHENQPFQKPATFYYTDNLRKEILKLKVKREPCEPFVYRSGNTQILALLLDRALNDKTVTDYFQEKIYNPAGMEFDGSWTIDHEGDGIEKSFCGINMTARDVAKIGSIYLHQGFWNDKQIVPKYWVELSTQKDTSECSAPFYQYGWWLMSITDGDYRGDGAMGQFLYINPKENIVIVRLGKNMGKLKWKGWMELIIYIAKNTK